MPTKFSVTDLLSSSLTSVTRGRHIIREMERKAFISSEREVMEREENDRVGDKILGKPLTQLLFGDSNSQPFDFFFYGIKTLKG